MIPELSEIMDKHVEIEKHKKTLAKLRKKHQKNGKDNDDVEVYKKKYCCGLCGEKRNIYRFLSDEKAKLEDEIRGKLAESKMSCTGIIQLKSMHKCALYQTALITHGLSHECAIELAPNIHALDWHNCNVSKSSQYAGTILTNLYVLVLFLFSNLLILHICYQFFFD